MYCNTCKKEFEPELKSNGEEYKTCTSCREKQMRYKCEHNRQRSQCKDCRGTQICEHDRQRSTCKDCRGTQICEHDRQRSRCKDCKGASICEHDRQRSTCKDCRGTQICEHNRQRSKCKDCKGGGICEHNRQRSSCIICTPSRSCQNCKIIYVGPRYRFHPYCFSCYCVLNPDVEIPRKYKLKEHYFREFLKEEYKDIELVFDKIVGESNKRPDVLISFEEYNVILELDENQHRGYDCESKRIMEIFQDLGSKPLVMLRINPDTYLDRFGKRVPGCFKSTKTIGWKKDEIEWKRRLDIVKDQLNYFMENPPEKEVDINYFFYDEV